MAIVAAVLSPEWIIRVFAAGVVMISAYGVRYHARKAMQPE
jgi:hypothetical protein